MATLVTQETDVTHAAKKKFTPGSTLLSAGVLLANLSIIQELYSFNH